MKLLLRVAGLLLLSGFLLCCNKDGPTPVVTMEWEPDGSGYRQFSTNDIEYEGASCWYYTGDSHQDPMTSVITKVKQLSGPNHVGVGVIFCFQDHDNFYLFEITTGGEYGVWKRVDGKWSEIVERSDTGEVYRGLDRVNRLKVMYEETAADTFTLYVNGTEIDSFVDPKFSGGFSGYECYVRPGQSFPDIPVDARFQQLVPVPDP